jgi:hypothetical protein
LHREIKQKKSILSLFGSNVTNLNQNVIFRKLELAKVRIWAKNVFFSSFHNRHHLRHHIFKLLPAAAVGGVVVVSAYSDGIS